LPENKGELGSECADSVVRRDRIGGTGVEQDSPHSEEVGMSGDAGGWLWLFIDVVLVALLAAGLIYGTMMWRKWRKHPVRAAEREQKTRELFRDGAENRPK
jgi:hypothetical protein